MGDNDQTPDRPVPDRSGSTGGGLSRGASTHYGMSWVALAALLFMVVVVGWRLLDFWDSTTPPSGVETQQATVLGFGALGTSRAGSKSADYSSVAFELPDGERATALYELRRLGNHEKGDTITVFESNGEWRTTVERSWGGVVGWLLGLLALLVMIAGWIRVRVRVRARRGDPTP